MDDLISLVFFGALVLLSLLSGKKKKRQHPPRPRVQRSPPERVARPREERTAQERGEIPRPVRPKLAPATTNQAQVGPKDLASELMKILQGQVVPDVEPRPVLPEPEIDDEAETLEELQVSNAERHEEFHKKYFAPLGPKPGRRGADVYHRAHIEFNKKSLRHAFVMKEVLGPPKGLEEH